MTFYVWHDMYQVGTIIQRYPDGSILALFAQLNIQEKLNRDEYTLPHVNFK